MASFPTEEEYGYEDSRFKNNVDENFHCSICYNVLKEPRMCRNNEHIFCLACITQHLKVNSQSCPECNEHLKVDTLRRPRVLNNYLSKLNINCDYASRGCPEFTCVEDLKTHVSNCGFAPVVCSNENCGMVINKQGRVHHEYEVCKYRKIKCHDCGQIHEVLGRLEKDLMENNKMVSEKVEALEENITQELKTFEVVKKEVKYVKNNLSKVNKDMAELKVIMSQMLGKLNKLELMGNSSSSSKIELNISSEETMSAGSYESVSTSSPVLQKFKSSSTPINNPRRVWTPHPANVKTSLGIVIPGQDVLNPSVLAQASAADQKQILGERLFPLIQQSHPDLAGKITGMLLEMDNAQLIHMLEFRHALAAKVEEAVSVLHAYASRVRNFKKY